MTPIGVIVRPRRTLEHQAAAPSLVLSTATVVASGVVAGGIGVATAALDRSGASGVVASVLSPAFFVGYWLLQGWLIDAAAGMVGRNGRLGRFLAASGCVFIVWIAYALLALAEAASGGGLASALTWLTVPVLLWILLLTTLAIRAVYRVASMNAVAFALLPYAAVTAALLVVGAVRG